LTGEAQMPKRLSPQRKWEQALIDAYCDHRWRQILQPLYDVFQRWAAGELEHADLDHAIHETQKKSQQRYGLFTQSQIWLVCAIQVDEDWYRSWAKDHPPPAEPAD
jgi:hypothetical protein